MLIFSPAKSRIGKGEPFFNSLSSTGKTRALYRRISLILVLVGTAATWWNWVISKPFPLMPFPTAGLRVTMNGAVSTGGDYLLQVAMPTTDASPPLDSEVVPCALTLTITPRSRFSLVAQPEVKKEISELSRVAGLRAGGLQYYRGGERLRLNRGFYRITIQSSETCALAAARGAAVSLEQDINNPVLHYLIGRLWTWFPIMALCAGLIGLVATGFTNPMPSPRSTAAAAKSPAAQSPRQPE